MQQKEGEGRRCFNSWGVEVQRGGHPSGACPLCCEVAWCSAGVLDCGGAQGEGCESVCWGGSWGGSLREGAAAYAACMLPGVLHSLRAFSARTLGNWASQARCASAARSRWARGVLDASWQCRQAWLGAGTALQASVRGLWQHRQVRHAFDVAHGSSQRRARLLCHQRHLAAAEVRIGLCTMRDEGGDEQAYRRGSQGRGGGWARHMAWCCGGLLILGTTALGSLWDYTM